MSEFNDYYTSLEAEGYEIFYATPAAPFQMEGVFPTGELFYFRMRHEMVHLSVWLDDTSADPRTYMRVREMDLIFDQWKVYEDCESNDFSFPSPELVAEKLAEFLDLYTHSSGKPIDLVVWTLERRQAYRNAVMHDLVT